MLTLFSSSESQLEFSRTRMERWWIGVGATFGLMGVAAGAAGVHALQNTLDADALDTFETAVRFQMFHALALLVVGALAGCWRTPLMNLTGGLLTAGVVLFSGSLYLLALTDVGAFGAVAPVGGACLLAGWASLLVGAMRR